MHARRQNTRRLHQRNIWCRLGDAPGVHTHRLRVRYADLAGEAATQQATHHRSSQIFINQPETTMKIQGKILKSSPTKYVYSDTLGNNNKLWASIMMTLIQDTTAHKQIEIMHKAGKKCAIVIDHDTGGNVLARQVICADEIRSIMYFSQVNEVLDTYRSHKGYAVIAVQAEKVSASIIGTRL